MLPPYFYPGSPPAPKFPPMDLGLAGRVALVCGSTKGLGRAVAKALAHEGARVAVNGRHEDAAERAAQQLASETGQQVMAFVADVGERGEAEGLVERVHPEMGRGDVLFCNASGPPAAPFAPQSADAFQRAVGLNLLSTLHPSRSAVPIMRKLPWRRSGPAILPAPCCRWTVDSRDPFSDTSRISHPASRVFMQAIVKERRAPGLKVATVPKPSPGPADVLIAVRHAGVCGTDVHIADSAAWAETRIRPPVLVGHEFAGEIVAVGDGVSGLKPGQLVTAEGHIVCGHCLQCRTGNGHICKNTRIIGVDRDGAFAEYIVMPATNVLPLDGIPTTIGAVMDPMGNAFHTVLTADIPGDRKSVV